MFVVIPQQGLKKPLTEIEASRCYQERQQLSARLPKEKVPHFALMYNEAEMYLHKWQLMMFVAHFPAHCVVGITMSLLL